MGAWDFVKEMKEKGFIKHLGFSFHDKADVLEEILLKHPEAEFVQLQINYMDWDHKDIQSGKCYQVARKYNKPIIIMEPIKGGMLSSETSSMAGVLKAVNPNASVASWALRFAASLGGLITVLSGMGSVEQMLDNINTVKNLKPLSENEQKAILEAVGILNSSPRIPCTGCRYCVEGCPQKINVPMLLNLYSDFLVYNTTANVDHVYEMFTREGGKANTCITCRSCEEHCPQHLPISETLSCRNSYVFICNFTVGRRADAHSVNVLSYRKPRGVPV
jgi:predicted aldo/keto reductase-like oxidoreductase